METYTYRPISVPGGGFVTGFVWHPSMPGILYCRTDIGGCYRYAFDTDQWISLIDHATDSDKWETYPLSIALDPQNPSYIYTMVGLSPVHKIGVSHDYGDTFTYLDAPTVDATGHTAAIHGNAPGRATGERLIVDPFNPNVLYMGTMQDGLFCSLDQCQTWASIPVGAKTSIPEKNIAFVIIDEQGGYVDSPVGKRAARFVVATSGQMGSPGDNVRGASLYITQDGGQTFEPLKGAPEPLVSGPTDHPGYVGQRAIFMDHYLFVTYSAYNIGWSNWDHYGCDTGRCYDGALYRFELDDKGQVVEALDITPKDSFKTGQRPLGHGFGGLSSDPYMHGTLICATINASQDTLYRSTDYGKTFMPILSGLDIGHIDFNVSYQKPEYNGQASLIHWMSDVKINPFNSNMALFNTGAGVFMTKNLKVADAGLPVAFACCNKGMEETVHLNIYSPPSGDVQLIDIIGDYGGFVFKDLDQPAKNTFANDQGDRWITAMNADYPDNSPNFLVTTPRGNWKDRTKGGLIASFDQGDTWQQLNDPIGLTKDLDDLVAQIKTPNVTSGWTAVSADGNTILWVLGLPIYANRLVYTHDLGTTWHLSCIVDAQGQVIPGENLPFKVMSDRQQPHIFYGFSDHHNGQGFFVSTDRGATFRLMEGPKGFPKVNLAGIDSEQAYEIRLEPFSTGIIYCAMVESGLWRLVYDLKSDALTGERVSKQGDHIKRIGIGKAKNKNLPYTLYTSGIVDGVYGFFKSHNSGVDWIRINDNQTQFGDIRSIAGDLRVYGRIYVATGTKGLVYGEPI